MLKDLNMISLPRLGRVTQGTIFCGAFANNYDSSSVWGVIITARCDTTHSKTPIVNYLPLIKIEDWLMHQGGLIIIDRTLADSIGRFKSLLKNKMLSDSLLDVYAPTEIARAHFPEPKETVDPKAFKKAESDLRESKQALAVAEEIEALKKCLDAGDDHQLINGTLTAYSNCRKTANAVVVDLLSHKLAGYYYLPDIGDLTEMPSHIGYVVLLREVRHLPQSSLKFLIEGISRDVGISKSIDGICFDIFDFACPIAEIKSPWIEHLMQAFCNLFGRIGVADIDKSHVISILDTALPKGEG